MTISASSVDKQLSWSGGGQSLCTRVEKMGAVSSRSTYRMVSWSLYPYRNSAYIRQSTSWSVYTSAILHSPNCNPQGPGGLPAAPGKSRRLKGISRGWVAAGPPGSPARRVPACFCPGWGALSTWGAGLQPVPQLGRGWGGRPAGSDPQSSKGWLPEGDVSSGFKGKEAELLPWRGGGREGRVGSGRVGSGWYFGARLSWQGSWAAVHSLVPRRARPRSGRLGTLRNGKPDP